MTDFTPFPKIPRLSRECVITEKIDGTNASIYIGEDGEFKTGSRTRWITPGDDNFGFAWWANKHKDELMALGPGHHFGEWWGQGIQRKYGLDERRFSLFNTGRWGDQRPGCCYVVPVLYQGEFTTCRSTQAIDELDNSGSRAAPGFDNPEGIVIYHSAANSYFKKTIKKDEEYKGKRAPK